MPKAIIYTAFSHHNECYKGEQWEYANLALITDRALRKIDVGDGDTDELPQRPLSNLQLSTDDVADALEQLNRDKGRLNVLIESMLD